MAEKVAYADKQIRGQLFFKAATELTLDTDGEITVVQSLHTVDTFEDAASDDLVTINGGKSDSMLYLRAAHTDRTVVIKHGTGNILTADGSDYSLDSADKIVEFVYDGSNWRLCGPTGAGTDNDAIHDNVAAEIVAITEKTLPVGNDEIVIEDSADSNNKKSVKFSSAIAAFNEHKNGLINGGFRIAQRGTSFTAATVPLNSDDTYLLDRWILLSDGNDIVDVTQETTTVPSGSYAAAKLEVETADKQFGLLTILEARDAARFIGQTVSLSFKARMAAADDNTHSLKAVVLAWDGTADAVTSDVVSAWGAAPSYVANWTAENTPGSNTLTTAYQTFKIEGIAIDTASAKNIAVFIFCDQTDGVVDDAVYITDVQLELGAAATPFGHRAFADELVLCMRYFEKSFGYGTVPADLNNYDSDAACIACIGTEAETLINSSIYFRTVKRTAPTIVFFNAQSTSDPGTWSAWDGGDILNKTVATNGIIDFRVGVRITITGGTAGRSANMIGNWTASAEL